MTLSITALDAVDTVMMSVVMLRVFVPSAVNKPIMLSAIILCDVILNVIMLNVVLLSVLRT
jgi:hypothetical protein